MTQPIIINGLNGSTGQPLQPIKLTTELLARVARQKRLSQDDLLDIKLRHAHDLRSQHHMGVAEGIEITNLAQAGWGIIFPASLDALRPLLELRCEQVGRYYFEFIGDERGYKAGETKNEFLLRFGRGAGVATGRAVRRLSDATGHKATTIHRLLEVSPASGFLRNEENPLEVDFLIVDEASMLDLLLQRNLLYTAITRAKTLCVLAGNRRAIGMAVRNNQVAKRFTALEWRLGK